MRPVVAQAGFTVLPSYCFADDPAMDAFLIPGGAGTRQEMYNRRLHQFVRALPESTILAALGTGPWVYAQMGLRDGLAATARKEGDLQELGPRGMVPIDRLASLAPRTVISREQIVDQGRIVTAAGISSGMEVGSHLLERAGFDPDFTREVARVMEYLDAYEVRRGHPGGAH